MSITPPEGTFISSASLHRGISREEICGKALGLSDTK